MRILIIIFNRSKGNLYMYIDYHAHASKRGIFTYANHCDTLDDQISNLLFPYLVSINSPYFDLATCVSSVKGMKSKDKKDNGKTKEGSGRVALYQSTKCIHCYTLESNYNDGLRAHSVTGALTSDYDAITPPRINPNPIKFEPSVWRDIGKASAIAMLDMKCQNPWSRVNSSQYGSISGLEEFIKNRLKKDVDYKPFFPPSPKLEPTPNKIPLKQSIVQFPPPINDIQDSIPPLHTKKNRKSSKISNNVLSKNRLPRSISPIICVNNVKDKDELLINRSEPIRYPFRPIRKSKIQKESK